MSLLEKLLLANLVLGICKIDPAPQPKSPMTEAVVDALTWIADDPGVDPTFANRIGYVASIMKTW